MQKLLTLTLFILSTYWGIAQQKQALLIGVGAYPSETGWNTLHAENDITLLQATLQKQGFQSIKTLQNEQATKEGILQGITQFIQQVQQGDIVVLSFSGHGQQMQDYNGDEKDGLDEAFVPYDSPKDFQKGQYEGERLLVDDELGKLLQQLRKKLGANGQVVVLMDACHSGTSTRGYGASRGTDVIMASDDYIRELPNKRKEKNSTEQRKAAGLAAIVTYFSSSSDQLSYEERFDNQLYGLLSYAFCKSLEQATTQTTYQDLFKKIQQTIQTANETQSPAMEGNGDLLLFKNQIVETTSYTTTSSEIVFGSIQLNAGSLQGFSKGTKVGFYEGIKTNTAKPFYTATIQEANLSASEVKIANELSEQAINAAKVYIEEQYYGGLKVDLNLQLGASSLKNLIEQELLVYPFIQEEKSHPALIIEQVSPDQPIILLTHTDQILLKASATEMPTKLVEDLKTAIEKHLRAQYLKTLEISSEQYPVEVALLSNHQLLPIGAYQIQKDRDTLEIKISNTGAEPFYFCILNIEQDNHIKVVFPWKGDNIGDYLIPPNSTFVDKIALKDFGFQYPPMTFDKTGREVLKIVCTPSPLDLRGVLDTRGKPSKAINNPLEVLMQSLFFPTEEDTRGASFLLGAEVGSIKSVVVDVVE